MECVKLCRQCRKELNTDSRPGTAYFPWLYEDDYECPRCSSKLVDTIISAEEYMIIAETSNTILFLETMINLKAKNLIEYQLKIQQFKTQIQQQEALEEQQRESKKPHCPTCGSSDLEKISESSKIMDSIIWGFGGKQRYKTYHCNNCGYEW